MSIQTQTLDYEHDGVVFEAFVAWDDSSQKPRPVVLVSHAFRGREQFECNKAVALAELGYVGCAIDVYGKGVSAKDNDHAFAMMNELTADRPLLQARLASASSAASALPQVDSERMAAIGFCFGGLCVLDMARCGLPLAGVASFHGLLAAPGNTQGNAVHSKVLVEHGWDDPMVSPEQVLEFAAEMREANADWQLHAHGDTVHSFTNPAADNKAGGSAYDRLADARSWNSLQFFLQELFA
jgi:dienelactone hydrolase